MRLKQKNQNQDELLYEPCGALPYPGLVTHWGTDGKKRTIRRSDVQAKGTGFTTRPVVEKRTPGKRNHVAVVVCCVARAMVPGVWVNGWVDRGGRGRGRGEGEGVG